MPQLLPLLGTLPLTGTLEQPHPRWRIRCRSPVIARGFIRKIAQSIDTRHESYACIQYEPSQLRPQEVGDARRRALDIESDRGRDRPIPLALQAFAFSLIPASVRIVAASPAVALPMRNCVDRGSLSAVGGCVCVGGATVILSNI
jgi:hypothetical protein